MFGSDYRTPPGHAEPPTSAQQLLEIGESPWRSPRPACAPSPPPASPRSRCYRARRTGRPVRQRMRSPRDWGSTVAADGAAADLIVVGSQSGAPGACGAQRSRAFGARWLARIRAGRPRGQARAVLSRRPLPPGAIAAVWLYGLLAWSPTQCGLHCVIGALRTPSPIRHTQLLERRDQERVRGRWLDRLPRHLAQGFGGVCEPAKHIRDCALGDVRYRRSAIVAACSVRFALIARKRSGCRSARNASAPIVSRKGAEVNKRR